jgi:pimeloyl-ACP methyl ester carboxylesterase
MHHDYFFLEDKKAQLHYSKYGNGNKVLLCFHGYGQSQKDFRELEDQWKGEYTIYSFDIFYHGQSFWHDKDHPMSKAYWCGLIGQFLAKHSVQKFSLMGYSMGGKFVLSLVEGFPERLEKVMLIAPDGIHPGFLYIFAAIPSFTKRIFRSMILKPHFFWRAVKVFRFMKLADKGLLRFAENQMATREQRRRAYYTWIVFKELKFDMKNISFILKNHKIRLELFLGIHDKIITESNMNKLLKRIDNYELIVLPSGHSHLLKAVADYFRKK